MEAANWDAARLGWDVLQTTITALIGVYVWWTGRTRATTRAIEQVDERLTRTTTKVERLEQTLENRPGFGDLNSLRAEIAETNLNLAELHAQLKGTTALLNRLHDYLLQERREK